MVAIFDVNEETGSRIKSYDHKKYSSRKNTLPSSLIFLLLFHKNYSYGKVFQNQHCHCEVVEVDFRSITMCGCFPLNWQ